MGALRPWAVGVAGGLVVAAAAYAFLLQHLGVAFVLLVVYAVAVRVLFVRPDLVLGQPSPRAAAAWGGLAAGVLAVALGGVLTPVVPLPGRERVALAALLVGTAIGTFALGAQFQRAVDEDAT